ncbi:Ig-like domain-containing protein [Methylobacterium oxalidis]|uniref:Ig-like domain-containing protein n=1 Tax=Methylobacterium oxalidis TaxID=944322 RepID=UPI003316170C
MGVEFNRTDLEFVLTQIEMAEAGQDPVNPHLTFGLRHVDGTDNSVVAGQPLYGSVDQPFPRLTNPVFQSADPSAFGPPGGPATSYASPTGSVFDADPRIISNLISDQSLNNNAAVVAALKLTGSQDPDADAAKVATAWAAVKAAKAGTDAALIDTANADLAALIAELGLKVENGSLYIENVTPDAGLSAPFNTLFTLFGQFFDHGLDLIAKSSASGTVFIPLKPDDPLYVPGAQTNFMVLTRATNQPGPDGVLGTADDVHQNTNQVTPFVDQNQTYTSHPSHQVFLREYMTGSDGRLHATGRLLEGKNGGEPTWADVKANALRLGILLSDEDVNNIPLLATDAYGNFIPDPVTGGVQVVFKGADGIAGTADDVLRSGTPQSPVSTVGAVRTGHQFLNDMAYGAAPSDPEAPGTHLQPDADTMAGGPPPAAGSYDNELLDAHYIAGDGRANENFGLTAIHEIFHDEHNRLVQQVKDLVTKELVENGDTAFASHWVLDGADLSDGIQDNEWNGERLFQAAKFGTETQYQHLVFEEFARKVSPAIHLFGNTNVHLDAAITSEFANAVYRFGHSMLDENLNLYTLQGKYLDANGKPTDTVTGTPNPLAGTPLLDAAGKPVLNAVGLIQAFTNPLAFAAMGTDAAGEVALGTLNQAGNEIDEFVTGALRNNLLGLPLDLAALNIARGRETGVAPLNLVRNQIYAQTHDSSVKPYESWSEFGQYLKHDASLINFLAAYGTHHAILEATTLDAKRAAALALIEHGKDGFSGGGVSAAEIKDAHDFMHSAGAYANITDPTALKANANALHDASGAIPFWSTGSITGLDQVDLWIGGLAEKQNLFGGLLGSTFDYIFRIQLENLQDGDRLYYLPRLEGTHFLGEIENNSFAEMIMHNLGTKHMSASVFLTPEFTVEASAVNPDDVSTWTRNESGKLMIESSWVLDGEGHHLKGSDGADIKSIHFLGEDNFFGNTMVLGGTEHDDHLFAGNADDDTVYGDGGNDVIDGGNGNDFLYGGAGDDRITDTAGDDTIHGDAGDDWIDGGIGDDIIFGNDGNDTLAGGKGIDDIQGGQGNDVIYGGENDDEIQGNEGDDWIEGGQGGDLLVGDAGAPTGQLPLYGADDVLIGGTWLPTGPDGHPVTGPDTDVAANGGDRMQGFSGDDIMIGGGGFNRFEGRNGFDWASYEFDRLGVSVDMNIKDFILDSPPLSPDAIRDRFIETEGLSGSSYDDVLEGTNDAVADPTNELNNITLITGLDTFFSPDAPVHFSGGNIILGGGGSDRIEGRAGNDIIDGDAYLHVRREGGQIVREILDGGRPYDVDTAVYSDIAANYVVGARTADGRGWDGLDAEGFFSVVHVTVGGGGGGAVGGGGVNPVVDDGTDKLRNIERLEFQDGVHTVGEFVFTAPTKNQMPFGTVEIGGNPVIGTLLTATNSLLDFDAIGSTNPAASVVPTVSYQWEYLDPARGEWVPITGATGATYKVSAFVVGQALRVTASFVDALGYREHVASAQTGVVTTPPNVNTAPFVVPQQGQVGLPDTSVLEKGTVNLYLPVTTVFGDAQTPAAQLTYTVTLANGHPLSEIGLKVENLVAQNGSLRITGTLAASVTGPVDLKVSATDLGPGTPLTVTDIFRLNVVHPTPGSQAVINGSLQDGYIAGATLFMDSNGDGFRQSFEAQATTDLTGHFTLVGKPGTLIATGGNGAVDTATNLAFNGTFKAPAGSLVVTPLTTILVELMGLGASLTGAQNQLRSALSLASGVDVTRIDPIATVMDPAASPVDKALAEHLIVTASQILDTVAILQAASPFGNAMAGIVSMIASGEPFDLANPATVAALVAQSNFFPPFSDELEALLNAHNGLVSAQAASSDGLDFLVGVAAVNRVAQGAASEGLATSYSAEEMAALLQKFTGAGLAEQVGYAKHHVGDVDGNGHVEGDGDETPPGLAITSAVDPEGAGKRTISGTAGLEDAGITVHILDNGTEIGTAVVDRTGHWSVEVEITGGGEHRIVASGTDGAGNTGQSQPVSVMVDDTPPAAPTVALDHDTGASAEDRVTSDPEIAVTPAESGGTLSYSIDGHDYAAAYDESGLTDGEHTVRVRHTDAAGNVSEAGTLTFTLDRTAPAAPGLALAHDTGMAGDRATADATLLLTPAETGGSYAYSVDGGDYAGSYDPAALGNGERTVSVRHTDAAGNVSEAASLTFTLDRAAPAAPTLALARDTGTAGDGLTQDAGLTVGGTETGATLSYKVDGKAVDAYDPASLADGRHTVSVTQTDATGNVSAAASLSFTLDRAAPSAPTITLANDTGLAGDRLTRDASLAIDPAEPGGTVTYSVDGGGYSGIYAPGSLADGQHSIAVKHTDAAGNTSEANHLTITLDTAAPAIPTLALANDTGTAGDRITGDPRLVATGAEAGGSFSYSVDGRAYGAYDPASLADGQHTVSVKHTDAAGNVSAARSLTFTLDTTAPGAPALALANDTGASQTDRITSDARVTATATQPGATLSYSLDGAAFGSGYDPASLPDGSHTLAVRQTDSAGNTSASAFLTFTLDRGAPQAPAVALADDTGLAGDGITRDGHLSATPAEAGGTLAYVVDGKVSATYDPATLGDGQHSVALRYTDAAGNAATSAPVSFTLDTTAPTLSVEVSGSGHTVGHTVSGTIGPADAGAVVTVRDGSAVLGTVTADAADTWSLPVLMTEDGPGHHYALTATATDAAGNVGHSESFVFDLDFSGNRDLFCTVGHDMRSFEGQVYALYDAILDRAPDAAGLEGWVGAMRNGMSLRDVADAFLHSAEAQAKFGGLDDRGFVGHLYETALHRSGEAAGLDTWTGALGHGASRADVALGFALSGENVAGMQAALGAGIYVDDHAATDAARLYYALLDRAPDAAGLQSWTQALKGGLSEAGMAQAFLGSGEFQAKHAGLSDAAFVDMLYENALGRHAETAGLANWTSALGHGATRAEVALGIAQSEEAHHHLAGHIEQGWHLA